MWTVSAFLVASTTTSFDSSPTPFKRRASPTGVKRAAVVVAELDQHDVARLEVGQNLIPEPFGQIRPAAPTAQGPVLDDSFCRVEVIAQEIPPAPEPITTLAAAVLDGRVADQEDGPRLRGRVVGDRPGRARPKSGKSRSEESATKAWHGRDSRRSIRSGEG